LIAIGRTKKEHHSRVKRKPQITHLGQTLRKISENIKFVIEGNTLSRLVSNESD